MDGHLLATGSFPGPCLIPDDVEGCINGEFTSKGQLSIDPLDGDDLFVESDERLSLNLLFGMSADKSWLINCNDERESTLFSHDTV